MACKLIRYEEENPEEYPKDKYVEQKLFASCDLIVDYRLSQK